MAKWKCSYSFTKTGEVVVEADSQAEADEKGMAAVEMVSGPWEVDIEEIDEGETP